MVFYLGFHWRHCRLRQTGILRYKHYDLGLSWLWGQWNLSVWKAVSCWMSKLCRYTCTFGDELLHKWLKEGWNIFRRQQSCISGEIDRKKGGKCEKGHRYFSPYHLSHRVLNSKIAGMSIKCWMLSIKMTIVCVSVNQQFLKGINNAHLGGEIMVLNIFWWFDSYNLVIY